MVESGTSTVEVEKERKLQSEGKSRTFSNNKHIFDKTSGVAYQSKDDLAKQYVEKVPNQTPSRYTTNSSGVFIVHIEYTFPLLSLLHL
jgi:hypothetical protein